jgi:hypothetical protein
MGGQGKVIQVDESLMRGKRKYNRGRLLSAYLPAERDNEDEGDPRHCNRIEGSWVFGLLGRVMVEITELQR